MFDTQPLSPKWLTLSVPSGGSTFLDLAAIDAGMAGINAASINTPLGTRTDNSSTSPNAYWNSVDKILVTRPTGNAMTLLMATLKNTSGSAIDSLTVSYKLTTTLLGNFGTEEIATGHRVYWSKTGAENTWVDVGDHVLTAPATTANISFDLAALSWAAGEILYVVWADDNGNGASDPDYRLDDVRFVPSGVVAGNKFKRGDLNNDGAQDLSDAIMLLGFLYLGQPATLICEAAGRLNDGNEVDLSDAIYLLGFLYLGTAAPPYAGYPGCEEFPACPMGKFCP